MIVFSPKCTAVHAMHMEAVNSYGSRCGLSVQQPLYGLKALSVFSTKVRGQALFVQSTGMANVIVLPLARLFGMHLVYYLHEPTPLSRKIRENGWIKSLVWHAVQICDCISAHRVLVSRAELAHVAAQNYPSISNKIVIGPLLMPGARTTARRHQYRVTYLGRPDERRYLSAFIAASRRMTDLGLRPTILTGDPARLMNLVPAIPNEIDVFAEKNFRESLKSRLLNETLCLWNPKRGEIAQSGVTADAVRFGVAVILTSQDPAYTMLRAAGIALDFKEQAEQDFKDVPGIDSRLVEKAAESIFSETHGELAFRKYYQEWLQ